MTTEAAGMGCDVRDVARVIQFGCWWKNTLVTLVQRLGRAARDPEIQGTGILLIAPPSEKRKHANKDIDFFFKTTGCRRAVLDEKFGNTSEPNKNCCDNCHPTKRTIRSKEITFVEVSAKSLTANRSATRTTEQKEQAKDIILAWRERMHEEIYAELCMFSTADVLMEDKKIDKLAKEFEKVKAVESIELILNWRPDDDYALNTLANDLIELNRAIDNAIPTFNQPQQTWQNLTISQQSSQGTGSTAQILDSPTNLTSTYQESASSSSSAIITPKRQVTTLVNQVWKAWTPDQLISKPKRPYNKKSK
ncbi:hypothetical protein KI688_004877 [Linnemannia hyalina]|uniref:Helicase C-terminal domain-containing protein n=1 Tax=Linnemannia hyalina TaxID=64524 RepID=A0A9P7XMK7_9FUNG|nr:hypothetical protein KI688_004877 [Linnemannia hyalina]